MRFFSNLFSNNQRSKHPAPEIDLDRILSNIEEREEEMEIPLGKKIYDFHYGELLVRFDRDITHNGRISIYRGKERLYSFTVFAKEGEYDILRDAFDSTVDFLESDRSINNLPDNDVLKGFYHHH
ncbi:hypothetical protein [Rhodohalobacter sulfatireducens]|uniref:Uncharacterized protein n=1 Tax=Rhodohalobacter sulfatireducens TaxID=2911366 RepID=A0ABS9KER7_9BACT|nr:hypothetical protein [Rhodohalobacter sulfatireducens]MCG2589336.1 hypothetical protein [Rhodohalobacter sulfatireducens]